MSPVFWSNLGPLSWLIAHALKPSKPPTLIVSIPRSGSSWVGSTLGRSPAALYLREPISQPYLLRHKRRGVVFRIDPDALPTGYRASARAAFAGLPSFSGNVVKFPAQWRLGGRRDRHVLVKEVNPFAVTWLIREFRPRIIYLIRHPAAVASSFARLGWMNAESPEGEERRFSAARIGLARPGPGEAYPSAWAEHAALQAMIMKETLAALAGYDAHMVVQYEELCADPHEGFRRLYDFAGFPWDEDITALIDAQTNVEEHNRYESYSLYRDSRAMAAAWKADVDAWATDDMREAYLRHGLPYYPGDAW